MKLVISLATRGRPQQLIETINRSAVHLVDPNTVMMIQVDDDDVATRMALDNAAFPRNAYKAVKVIVGPREDTIAGKWNRATKEPADVYLVAGDDDPFMTPGYDAKILDAAKRFPDGIGMVYGHLANLSFSGVVAPTAKFVEKLDHIFPEMFPYWFVDHWTDDVARLIGRLSFADVRTDQTRVGKTQEMREPGWWATFFDAAYMMRRSIAHKIIDDADFQGEAWHKDLLKTHHPLIEVRSRMINEGVRQQFRFHDLNSGLSLKDERYLRVRQKAVEMIPHLLDDYGMDKGEADAFRRALAVDTIVPNIPQQFPPRAA